MIKPQVRSERPNERHVVSPLFHIGAIAVCVFILALGLYNRASHFRTLDEPVRIEAVTPQVLLSFRGVPQVVNVGLYIDRFHSFDVAKNVFEMSGSVWFDYETGAISLKTLEKFAFERGLIVYRSEPDVKLIGSRSFVRYMIRLAFNTNLSFRDFPFDDHRIDLVLVNPFLSPEEFIFDVRATNFLQQEKLSTFGWNEVGTSAKSGFRKIVFSQDFPERKLQYPVAVFSIEIESHGFRYAISTLLPIFLIYYLMFFAFSVDTGSGISIALAGITGILAYRFVIESLSPVSSDLMLSDYFFFLILASSMVLFFCSNIDIFIVRLPVVVKKITIVLIHTINLILSLYFLSI